MTSDANGMLLGPNNTSVNRSMVERKKFNMWVKYCCLVKNYFVMNIYEGGGGNSQMAFDASDSLLKSIIFDYMRFPWTELSQWKYGPNICLGEDRCETGLNRAEVEIQASRVQIGEEKRTLLLFNGWLSVLTVQCYQTLGLHVSTRLVQANSVQGNHKLSKSVIHL